VFTRPADLSDADVRAALVRGWGLDVVAVEHAPVGFGSHHWWVTSADGGRWFATADDLRTRRVAADEPLAGPLARLRAALTTAATLREQGLDWVVAPRRADDEGVVVPVGTAFALSVYPRVDGRAFGWGPYEDPHHRAAVLDRLVVLHATTGCRGAAGTDDLGRALVAGLRALVDDPGPMWDGGPFAQEAWRLVLERGAALGGLLDRYEGLAAGADPARFVVTHGEPHRGNTLVTDTGVVLVDWDTCLLAPPERDVWLVAGEEPGILSAYEERTGSTLEAGLLEAYRLRWDLADVASFAADLRAPHDDDEDTRTARAGLRAVLEEGEP
jgi:spectinomycin phosphotransferase/16S rRNA (guanine(1405)-N(7))-methyltransferase